MVFSLLHVPVARPCVITARDFVDVLSLLHVPGVCTALDSASVTGPVSCRSGCTARGFVAFHSLVHLDPL